MAQQGNFASVADVRISTWSESRLAFAALLAVFTYVFVANSWVGDDAYISFRVVDNVVHGYGLTFNPPERVQAYTHPLWLLLHIPAYLVTGDVFYTTLALSYVSAAAAMAVAFRALGPTRSSLLALLAFGSKAFVDYTSSGLENPLSYLLIAVFFTRFLADVEASRPWGARDVMWYMGVASLAFVNRIDSVLLYGPPTAWIVTTASRSLGRRVLPALLIGSAPAVLWEVFSLVYYGFALPNTYYAKVATGLPQSLLVRQGFTYAFNSLAYDPVTLTALGLAALVAFQTRVQPLMAIGVALLLPVIYVIWIGGDHMAGRFFAAPFFCAALCLVWFIRSRPMTIAAGVALVFYNAIAPLAPIKSGPGYQQAWPWRETNGIQDERGYYHRATNLLLYNPLRDRPDHEWFRQGSSFARGGERVTVQGSIGFFGYQAGPDRFVVDPNALSDPLLARLPVSDQLHFGFYVGHYMRDLPEGYLESCAEGRNLLVDPLLRDVYDRLMNVTRGPLFSWSRVRDVWLLNVGRYRGIHSAFDARRSMRVSVPATHPGFRTDTGVRDPGREELRTAGDRAGYLHFGPFVPLRPGHYRVRWAGAYSESPPMPVVGFVEVWIDGRLIAQQDVRAADYVAADRTLTAIEFDLKRHADEADLRFYLHHGVKASLQSVDITGEPPVADP
jgi:arabinofuranosyltransferase